MMPSYESADSRDDAQLWTGSYLSLPSKTVAASVDKQKWEVGTNLPLRGRVSNLAALSSEGQELGGAGMDKMGLSAMSL
jgi:hypothetical protein